MVGKRPSGVSNFLLSDFHDETHATDLLNDPAQVFDYRVEEELNLSEKEAAELRTVFAELLDLHQEQERANLGTKSSFRNKGLITELIGD